MFYNILNSLFLIFVCASICVCKRPNFVVILTDDQDEVLGGMDPMKNVKRFIGNEGVTFTNSYTTSPVCCPSRASFLTGKYVHNHGTVNNSVSGGCYGPSWFQHEEFTFANVLQQQGYRTFYAGKYLNEYGKQYTGGPEKVPPGWSEWHGLVGNSVFYNYTTSDDGVPRYTTDLYLTDVIRDLAVSYIEKQTESGPFLVVLAPPAAHYPFTPAPRHRGVYSNVTAAKDPSFNIAVTDKHWFMRMPPSPLPDSLLPELDNIYRSRWETLLAVDEMVEDVVEALDTRSLLEDTYLVFTSDNGFHVGQFSQIFDKRQPYETDIKVPLLIRGPNLEKNSSNHQLVLNIDLAPTILDLAGIKPLKDMDGRPIDFENTKVVERNMLVEYHGEGMNHTVDADCPWVYDSSNFAWCSSSYACKCQDSVNNTYSCIRHIAEEINMKYCSFTDSESFKEMYDLNRDPYELKNVFDEVLPALRDWYQLSLLQMLGCRGAKDCNTPI